MTRIIKTVLTLKSAAAALTMASSAAHAGDTFTASFKYNKTASAVANLSDIKKTASAICVQQLADAGFRKTDTTSFMQRKCERALIKQAVKGTKDEVLMSLYKAGGKTAQTVQLAMNTK